MRILGIVPARGGSQRLPRKNLMKVGGRSLVARAVHTALGTACLDRVVVSSDDADILAEARTLGVDLALERPAELATAEAPAIDYVEHALTTLEAAGEKRFDAVVLLQPTSPFTRPNDVESTVTLMLSKGAESAASVMLIPHDIHPLKLKRLEEDRLLPYLEEERGRYMAHELPAVYVRNGAVYVARRTAIDTGVFLTDDCVGYVMPRERSLDINDAVDMAFADFLWTTVLRDNQERASCTQTM